MIRYKTLAARAAILASAGAALNVLLTGCGGSTTNATSLRPTVASSPQIYGLQPTAAVDDGEYFEVSGLGSPDGGTGYITGATASTGTVLQALGALPLGFSPGGQYLASTLGTATPAGASVIFAASISNGNSTTAVIPINPSSVVLKSPEVPAFSEALTFNASETGPLANATYRTGTFTLPFTTTGLHTLVASVADTSGQSATTTFDTLVLKPTDSAVVVQAVDGSGNILSGATVSITNALPGVTAYEATTAAPTVSVTDVNGVGIVFAAPGAQTITVTDGAMPATDKETLVAGQAFVTTPAGTTTTGTPYSITVPVPAAASARKGAARKH